MCERCASADAWELGAGRTTSLCGSLGNLGMSGVIDFYYEFASPYSYIAAQRLPALAAEVGRIVHWRARSN